MDFSTYGYLVEHGGYATPSPFSITSSPGTTTWGANTFMNLMDWMAGYGQLRQPDAGDPDDGAAGVLAKA